MTEPTPAPSVDAKYELQDRRSLGVRDEATFRDEVVRFLDATPDCKRILRVEQHADRPIKELILCHRRCSATPTRESKALVSALSGGQEGVRAFSGEACHRGYYIGNNLLGRGFYKPAVYCPSCGYMMTGPEIHEVRIVRGDEHWTEEMIRQCEFAGVEYSVEDPTVTEYAEGRQAFLDGKSTDANPYVGQDGQWSWFNGWLCEKYGK